MKALSSPKLWNFFHNLHDGLEMILIAENCPTESFAFGSKNTQKQLYIFTKRP